MKSSSRTDISSGNQNYDITKNGEAVKYVIQTITSSAPTDHEAIIGFFECIALEEGWEPGSAFRKYHDRSIHFALSDSATSVLQGGLLMVCPDTNGTLPCHEVWPELPASDSLRTAHIVVLAVGKDWRRRGAGSIENSSRRFGTSRFWTLTGALWRYCMDRGITDLWLEATPTMLRCYRLLGWPLQVRGPLRSHWNEDCYPCSLSLRETAGALVEKALRSRTYRQIIENALDTRTDQGSGATTPTA